MIFARQFCLLAAMLLAGAGGVRAGEPDPAVHQLPEFDVLTGARSEALPEADGQEAGLQPTGEDLHRSSTLAVALARLPGVSLQRRGANAAEPIVRGFDFDRVVTRFNGLPLPNASPTRTGAAVNAFTSGSIGRLRVVRGLPSVVDGPVPTGGQLQLESFDDTRPSASAAFDDGLDLRACGDRGGRRIEAWSDGNDGRVHYRLAGHYAAMGDYTAGDGRTVDADYETWGGGGAFRHTIGATQVVEGTVHGFHQERVRNSSLPLDTRDTDLWAGTLAYAWKGDGVGLRLRAGHAETRPFLTSQERTLSPTAAIALIEARGRAASQLVGAAVEVKGSPEVTLVAGFDVSRQERRALRQRFLRNGRTLGDQIWPGLFGRDRGIFAEVQVATVRGNRLRLGGRFDRSESGARFVEAPVLGVPGARGGTIRQNFVAFNGPAAASDRRKDEGGAVNLRWEHDFSPMLTGHMGVGLTVAPPGPSERYRAFVNALGGGVEVGNPALDPERKTEIQAGFRWQGGALQIEGECFSARVDHFVHRRIIQAAPVVYGFRNIDAEFHGGELALRWQAEDWIPGLSLSLSGEAVWAWDRDRGGSLPEIPPREGRVAVRYEQARGPARYWTEIESNIVGGRINPQPAEMPIFRDTAGHVLCTWRGGVRLGERLRVEIAVENVFDRLYLHYLQPPVAEGDIGPSGGSLKPGDAVPGPGRNIEVSARWFF